MLTWKNFQEEDWIRWPGVKMPAKMTVIKVDGKESTVIEDEDGIHIHVDCTNGIVDVWYSTRELIARLKVVHNREMELVRRMSREMLMPEMTSVRLLKSKFFTDGDG